MSAESIRAYDLPARVASYDADMNLMHPNRAKMADVILGVLEAADREPALAIDLGTGTGFLLHRYLAQFPDARAVAIDGAREMVDLAHSRLGALASRVDFRVGDFRRLSDLTHDLPPVDAMFSCFALHHLDPAEKLKLIRAAATIVRPGGWLLNADIVIDEDGFRENLIQASRVRGIVRRAAGSDARFLTQQSTRAFLDQMGQNEGDQPLTLTEDLQILGEAGFKHVGVFWRETREVVYGGIR